MLAYKHPAKSKLFKWQILMAAVIFMLAVLYIKQINNQAEYSYTIRNLEKSREGFQSEISALTWQTSEAGSLAQLRAKAEILNLQKPQEMTFLRAGLHSVAALADELTR